MSKGYGHYRNWMYAKYDLLGNVIHETYVSNLSYLGEWETGKNWLVNDFISYNGKTYKVVKEINNSIVSPDKDTMHFEQMPIKSIPFVVVAAGSPSLTDMQMSFIKNDNNTSIVYGNQVYSRIGNGENDLRFVSFTKESNKPYILLLTIDDRKQVSLDVRMIQGVDTYTKQEIDALLNNKASKATTLAGYNINDAYTKTEVDNLISHAGGSDLTAGNTFIVSITPLLIGWYEIMGVSTNELKDWFNEWFDDGADITLPFYPEVGLVVPFISLMTLHYHSKNNFPASVAGYNESKIGFLYKGKSGSSGQEVSSYSLAEIWVKENSGVIDYSDILIIDEKTTISYRGNSFKEMLNLLTGNYSFSLFPDFSSHTGPFPSGLVSISIMNDSFVVPYNYFAKKIGNRLYDDKSADGEIGMDYAIESLLGIN